MRGILYPVLSRRIYARRAVACGLLLILSMLLAIVMLEAGGSPAAPLAVPSLIFSLIFTPLLRSVVLHYGRLQALAHAPFSTFAYPVVFFLAPLIAPATLLASTVQFVRSHQ